jgi:diguanylate cyclase (GGDEF)-like protein/PAS domain S-box-containing protein
MESNGIEWRDGVIGRRPIWAGGSENMHILTKDTFKPTVLCVEDDEVSRHMLSLVVSKEFPHAALITAENGQEGLDLFRKHAPDLIITDVRMPVMDGIRMAKKIRELNKDTRFIVITADNDINRVLEAIDIGINQYVLKPINNVKLLSAIKSCLTGIEQERHVREQLEFFRKLSRAVDQGPVANIVTDAEGNIEFVNPGFTRLTGYTYSEAIGKNVRILKSGGTPSEEYRRLWKAIQSGEEWWGEFLNRKKSGELFWVSVSISPITDASGRITNYLSRQEDITERKQKLETILHMAYYDSLTGLPNRYLFQELLQNALTQAQRHCRMLAVLFLDLDRFKNIHDSLGHSVGDQLLQATAQRLRDCCSREGDIVARRGGDEFIILLPELKDLQGLVRVAQRIIDAFNRSFNLPENELSISTSIGISIFPQDGSDPETLIKKADTAMYCAKEDGRNRYHLFKPGMNSQPFERETLENSLHKALDRGEFLLYYQPKINVKTGLINSIEALARWHHPELGMVPPTQFIPMAEETGVIGPLGEWVLRTACLQNKAWQDAGHPPMRIAVNFSPRQIQYMEMADMVERVLAETLLDPRWLELEITENVMLRNEKAAIHTICRLSKLGVHISIDDFGTGFSTFSYVKKIPINTIKIDRSFVSDICSNLHDEAIATAVINMAQCLNLNVIAEGVETEEQRNLLESLNCSEMQGYLFSRPLPADELSRFLKKLQKQQRGKSR